MISGLCIRLSHRAQRSFSTLHFYWRRWWRIYPPYLISLFTFALIEHASVGNVLAHVFMAHNFSLHYHFAINSPFWSLALEFQVYLLYPVLLWLHCKFGSKITFPLLTGLAVVTEICGGESFRQHFHLPAEFAVIRQMPTGLWITWYAGFLIADRLVDGESITSERRWILLGAPCLAPMVVLYRPLTPIHEVVNAILLSFGVEEFLRCRIPGSRVGKWVGLVGVSSYSFYLYFEPLIRPLFGIIQRIFGTADRTVLFVSGYTLVFGAIALFSYAAYRVIELPSIAVGRTLYGRMMTRRDGTKRAISASADLAATASDSGNRA